MKKRLFAVILTLCMCLVNVTTAFATEESLENSEKSTFVTNEVIPYSGEEIWDGSGTVHVGSFTMEGNNLTPVKIAGYSGPLAIITNFRSTRSNTPVYLRVEIRDWATQRVLGYKMTSTAMQSGNLTVQANVDWHQKIQIFFKVFDRNGNYISTMPCWIDYSYNFYMA